jgi:hypothetical protein
VTTKSVVLAAVVVGVPLVVVLTVILAGTSIVYGPGLPWPLAVIAATGMTAALFALGFLLQRSD